MEGGRRREEERRKKKKKEKKKINFKNQEPLAKINAFGLLNTLAEELAFNSLLN